jgi:predicted NBD/HSP70 family sugar kinase
MFFNGGSKLLVIAIEASSVTQCLATTKTGKGVPSVEPLPSWDLRKYTDDPSGRRLFEEVGRRCLAQLAPNKTKVECVAICMPGSIQGEAHLSRSSRINVLAPIDVGQLFRDLNLPRTVLLRDVDCLAIGQHAISAPEDMEKPADHVYLLVDEGVGSSIFINGKSYRGAGHAGPIGRLIVEPNGAYNPSFRSHGPLEVFVGRPWISENIVNQLLTENAKNGDSGSEAFCNRPQY